ncbi:alanine--tRNA ligase [Oleiharenicola lentus]|uniref:alanine--tRNA ligase n=1 Tax=Oleiharenicola lentus TaxID=2508720 RepID=UPI003F67ACF9
MTSAEIRQSFLDFFAKQGHTIVPSSSLLPDSPGLLFTNAGMNQFVPIFLGDRAADVSKWAGVKPAKDTRAADTQKCIRAGGKHNDLEDVGFDTYHHTLFEMLGNWSFGDYFKKESLNWGWELITKVWGIPAKRLYATVYSPDKSKNDPSEFDQEAYDIWAEIFTKEGLDPAIHIVHGNKKDNFWMMGDTGPCGPCSEIHFNLLPSDDEVEGRKGVNSSSPRCIEIWNHVFIQFNANADGTFSPLAAKHVDTGMGFERVAGIYATTKGFKDFSAEPSNYEADVFAPLFAKITALSGKTYTRTVPTTREGLSEQYQTDIAFRVLADHARTISCAIADGILPGNDGRNYVIRRILRRGILYGKKLGLQTGFFEQLVAPVVESLGTVFPELKQQQSMIQRVIRSEEESFGRTLEKGLQIFSNRAVDSAKSRELLESRLLARRTIFSPESGGMINGHKITNEGIQELIETKAVAFEDVFSIVLKTSKMNRNEINSFARDLTRHIEIHSSEAPGYVPGTLAFELYDTYGFPLDMTQLLATERGLTVDAAGFEAEMEKQRERGRAAHKKEIVVAATEGDAAALEPTKFLGYTETHAHGKLTDVITADKDTFLVFDQTPFYAEMGGQTGDTGTALVGGELFYITDCVKDKSGRHLHKLAAGSSFTKEIGTTAELAVDVVTRRAINRHHSAAHLIHWALRKVLGTHVRQAGTSKTADRMRFDFSHFEAATSAQLREVEQLVNEKVIDNAKVEVYETEFDKKPEGTLAFFGDKYGKFVRVVDIGGYSRELCGGTHVSTTGEIGSIKIVAEMAIAAGTRRIEAVAGNAAYEFSLAREQALAAVGAHLSAGPLDVNKKLESVLAHQKELEKKLKAYEQKASAALATELAATAVEKGGVKWVSAVVTADNPDALRSLGSQILGKLGEGVVQIGALFNDKPSLVVYCSPAANKAGFQAGKLVGELAVKLGGKGGGKPDFAMGGGKDATNLANALKL